MGHLPQKLQEIRKLDIDDLLILMMLGDGCSFTEIADALCLTTPAIYQRAYKIKSIWGDKIVFPHRRLKLRMSPYLQGKASRARVVLKELNSWFEDKEVV